MKSKKICSLLMIMGLVMSSGVLLASCGANNDSTQNSTQSEVKVSKLNLDTSKVKTEKPWFAQVTWQMTACDIITIGQQ